MRSNLPPKEKFLGKTIKGIPDYVIREYVASGSNGHLYRAVNEQTNNEWALKIVPISNVISKDERDEYLEEARKANALENRSVVRYHRVVKHSAPNPSTSFSPATTSRARAFGITSGRTPPR